MDRREFLYAQTAALVAATGESVFDLSQAKPDIDSKECKDPGGFPVALWLAPILEDRREIEKTIKELSDENNFPLFRAHATLCAGTIPDLGESLKRLLEKVDEFCGNHSRRSIKTVEGERRIDHKTEESIGKVTDWSTFLFLRLHPDDVYEAAEKFTNSEEKFCFKSKKDLPHVSLAYCDPTQFPDKKLVDLKAQAGARLKLSQVSFEAIEVVMPEAKPGNCQDVKSKNMPGDWGNIISTMRDSWNVVYAKQFNRPQPKDYKGLRCVVAGGQAGIDQTALEAAYDLKLATGGWCPPKGETLTGLPPVPKKFGLQETPERNSTNAFGRSEGAPTLAMKPDPVARSLRTEWNCRDSDATLVVPASSQEDVGTIWTVRFAHDYKKPVLNFQLSKEGEVDRICKWLCDYQVEVLNVAGPARLNAEEQQIAKKFFHDLFQKAARTECLKLPTN